MFEDVLRMTLSRGTPRVLVWADYYMKTFAAKQLYARTKASHNTYRTNGIRHLLLILKNSRLYYVPNQSRTSDQFELTVESVARSVSRVSDQATTGGQTKNFFVKSRSPYSEVLMLSNLTDPESRLPSQIGYYTGWRDIKPLRMIEMSAMPLTLDISNNLLNYAYADAGFGVFALDTAALILKYESYRREFALPGETEDDTMVRYLVSDVISPCLLTDSFALWVRNQYRNIFVDQVQDFKYLDAYWPTESTQVVGAGYSDFLRDIETVKKNLVDKTIWPDRVFWSLPVSTDNTSVAAWLTDLLNTVGLPDQFQYQWASGLAYFGWLEFLWIIERLSGSKTRYASLVHRLYHPVSSWVRNHPWDQVRDPTIKTYIKNHAVNSLALIEADSK